ncbi:MAG: N-acetylmannosamine-6-phosphate 2-epimerase [Candidatus Baltobacteraceae bacterium]
MTVLDALRGGLIVSVQAAPGSALDDPRVLAAMAAAAVEGGACGVRIQGAANLRAVCARVSVPVIGLIKRSYEGFEPYITPSRREVDEVLAAGACIVAFDATAAAHPAGAAPASLIAAIHEGGALAMADCAQPGDGPPAAEAGADIVATTLCGYTAQTRGEQLPALALLDAWSGLSVMRICEGGVHSPESVCAAIGAGADAVVVGTAITNVSWMTARFAAGLKPKSSRL